MFSYSSSCPTNFEIAESSLRVEEALAGASRKPSMCSLNFARQPVSAPVVQQRRSTLSDILALSTESVENDSSKKAAASSSPRSGRPMFNPDVASLTPLTASPSRSSGASSGAFIFKFVISFYESKFAYTGKYTNDMLPELSESEYLDLMCRLNDCASLGKLRNATKQSKKMANAMFSTWLCGIGIILVPICIYLNFQVTKKYEEAFLSISDMLTTLNQDIFGNRFVRVKMISDGSVAILIKRFASYR